MKQAVCHLESDEIVLDECYNIVSFWEDGENGDCRRNAALRSIQEGEVSVSLSMGFIKLFASFQSSRHVLECRRDVEEKRCELPELL